MSARVDFQALSELRYQIRVFLSFSEQAARALGVEPKQHQLLLAVKGLPEGARPTLGVLAERLRLRHHSVVELVDRLERGGLAKRVRSPLDRRESLVRISARGERLLRELSLAHQTELQSIGPALARALSRVVAEAKQPKKAAHELQRTRARR